MRMSSTLIQHLLYKTVLVIVQNVLSKINKTHKNKYTSSAIHFHTVKVIQYLYFISIYHSYNPYYFIYADIIFTYTPFHYIYISFFF